MLAFAFGTAFRVFVSNPVNMGKCRYFVHNRFGDSRFEHLFGAFRRGYPTAVGAMFTTDLLIDLWLYILIALMAVCLVAVIGGAYMMSLLMIVCLLLFIPYFIKLYQYTFCQIPAGGQSAAQRDARPPAQHHAHQRGKGFPLCARPVLPGMVFPGRALPGVGASVRQPVLRSDQGGIVYLPA